MSELVSNATKPEQSSEERAVEEVDSVLICWEEWALSMEEHFNALDKFRNNPKINQLKKHTYKDMFIQKNGLQYTPT